MVTTGIGKGRVTLTEGAKELMFSKLFSLEKKKSLVGYLGTRVKIYSRRMTVLRERCLESNNRKIPTHSSRK